MVQGMVARAIISKNMLDGLIRAKLTEDCANVDPMPVIWRQRVNGGCNWVVPGWTGDSSAVQRCVDRMGDYLRILRTQFDIPEEA